MSKPILGDGCVTTRRSGFCGFFRSVTDGDGFSHYHRHAHARAIRLKYANPSPSVTRHHEVAR